jgi:hypothetical protein
MYACVCFQGKNLCNQYAFTANEFVSEVDAFRVNAGLSSIDLSHLGKIEGIIRNLAQVMLDASHFNNVSECLTFNHKIGSEVIE